MTNGILLESLYNYYDNKQNMNKLVEVLEEDNKISLRIIDWFVTIIQISVIFIIVFFKHPRKRKHLQVKIMNF